MWDRPLRLTFCILDPQYARRSSPPAHMATHAGAGSAGSIGNARGLPTTPDLFTESLAGLRRRASEDHASSGPLLVTIVPNIHILPITGITEVHGVDAIVNCTSEAGPKSNSDHSNYQHCRFRGNLKV